MEHARTFRVFISSTFADLVEERNALQRDVWPELRARCEKAGCRFQAIDLRWGIPEEAGLDQRTVRLCLQELQRCRDVSPRPNFVILLGDRYGWRPLPEEIEASEFARLVASANERQLPAAGLLSEWYRPDANAVPPVYYLRPRTRAGAGDRDFTDPNVWTERVEKPLRDLLATCAAAVALSDEARVQYERSLTEREILAGALSEARADAREHVFAYLREIDGLTDFAEHAERAARFIDFVVPPRGDAEASGRQSELKDRVRTALGPERVREYRARWTGSGLSADHLAPLCAAVLDDLWGVISAEIATLSAVDPQVGEASAHRQFAEARGGAGRFRGREDLLGRVASYLGTAVPRPLALVGPAGTGKSAAVARAAVAAREHLPGAVVVERFVGTTPGASSARALLGSACAELNRAFGRADPVPAEYRDLAAALRDRLAWATAERPVVLFLDALDQLDDTDNARSLVWLPRQLPPHARVVVSALDDPTGAGTGPDPAAVLRARAEPGDVVALGDYPRGDAGALLDAWLAADRRALTPAQREFVLAAFERCPRPLFLKLAAEEAKGWRSDTADPRLPEAGAPDAMLSAVINQFFDRLSAPSNHGPLLVERAVGYLAASKHGLTEDELLGLLSADTEFFDKFRARAKSVSQELPAGTAALPVAVWARLYSDLQPYLTARRADGTTLLGFYHRTLEEAARARFLGDPAAAGQRHRHIAHYFTPAEPHGFFRLTADEQRAWAKRVPLEPRPVNVRMVVELPHQLLEAAKRLGGTDPTSPHWAAVTNLLLDIHFLEAKAEARA
jgi:hypothetical protein